jgi:Tfp pilus assembly protein PilE
MKKDIESIVQNKQLPTESGRSMVEMLGVLAIIGVLSIGGIAGYTYAMNRSKANDILDGVSKRAVVVSQQMILGNTASLVEYKNRKISNRFLVNML